MLMPRRPTSVIAGLRFDRGTWTGLSLVLTITLIALAAPILAPYDPVAVDVLQRLSPPTLEHPMGTDHLGRDYLSRVVYGARTSFSIAVLVVAVETVVGVAVGAVAGYLGGLTDGVLMRGVDVVLAFPGLILALALAALLGPSTTNLIIALVAVGWVTYARLVRGIILSVKAMPFVESSRAIGCRPRTIVGRHILPHVVAPLLVLTTLNMGNTILAVSSLSFLGLGVQAPVAEWGAMLTDGRTFLESAPYLMVFPGLMIVLSVLAFNLIGDGLRDALDPRVRQRVEI